MDDHFINCPNCGKKIRSSVVFCPYCDTQIGSALDDSRTTDGAVPVVEPDAEPIPGLQHLQQTPEVEQAQSPGLRQAQSPEPAGGRKLWMKWLPVVGGVLALALIAGGIGYWLGRDKPAVDVVPTSVPTDAATEAAAEAPAGTEPVPAQVAGSKIPADCKPYSLIETFFSNARTDISAVTDADWVKGPGDAEFTVIVYSDFQ